MGQNLKHKAPKFENILCENYVVFSHKDSEFYIHRVRTEIQMFLS